MKKVWFQNSVNPPHLTDTEGGVRRGEKSENGGSRFSRKNGKVIHVARLSVEWELALLFADDVWFL